MHIGRDTTAGTPNQLTLADPLTHLNNGLGWTAHVLLQWDTDPLGRGHPHDRAFAAEFFAVTQLNPTSN
jgi:hypothetical protein